MPKYLICPGKVRSRDGDVHFIGAPQLIELYRVDPKDCVIEPKGNKARFWKRPKDVIELYPRSRGDYSIPKAKQEPTNGN